MVELSTIDCLSCRILPTHWIQWMERLDILIGGQGKVILHTKMRLCTSLGNWKALVLKS